jgi:hypothetical protein
MFDKIYLYILLILYISTFDIPILVKTCISLSFVICITLFFYYSRTKLHTKNMPKASVEELYNILQEGDVLFNSEIRITNHFLNYFDMNRGIYHSAIIRKKNGIKTILHCYPMYPENRIYHPECILQKYPFLDTTWITIEEPLLDYLLIYPSIYQIVKAPIPHLLKIKKGVIERNKRYCTLLIGDILYTNGIIEKDHRLVQTYNPEYIIEMLIKKGYKNFYIKQE